MCHEIMSSKDLVIMMTYFCVVALFVSLIIYIFQLVFSAGIMFFSHNNSGRTVFSVNSAKFQQAEWGLRLEV